MLIWVRPAMWQKGAQDAGFRFCETRSVCEQNSSPPDSLAKSRVDRVLPTFADDFEAGQSVGAAAESAGDFRHAGLRTVALNFGGCELLCAFEWGHRTDVIVRVTVYGHLQKGRSAFIQFCPTKQCGGLC